MKKSWFVIAAAIPLVVVGSIAVWQLSGSDTRRVGALGPLKDPVPLSWRGEWSSEMRYRPGEVVSLKGYSYVAEQENEANSPQADCEECPWAIMAAQGPQGPSGTPGGAGPTGPQGAQGPQGQTPTLPFTKVWELNNFYLGGWQIPAQTCRYVLIHSAPPVHPGHHVIVTLRTPGSTPLGVLGHVGEGQVRVSACSGDQSFDGQLRYNVLVVKGTYN